MYIYICMSFSKVSKRYDFLLDLHFTISKIKYYPRFMGSWAAQVWFVVRHDKLYILSPCILFIILVYDTSLPCKKYFNVYEPPADILFLRNFLLSKMLLYTLSFWSLLPARQPSVTALFLVSWKQTNWKGIVTCVGSNLAVRESGHIEFLPGPREWGPGRMAGRVPYSQPECWRC